MFVFVFVLWGCAPEDVVIDRRFDACQALVIEVRDATPARRVAVDAAIVLWRARGVTTLTTEPAEGAPTVPLVFEPASPVFHGYYDDELGVIYVNTSLEVDPYAGAITIAHELGHAFGLYHVAADERVSLMNPSNLTVAPTVEDQRALERLWGPCAP